MGVAMNRRDLVAFELFYADTLRREAKARAKRYPQAAALLTRHAEAAVARAETIRCGPLFTEKAA